DGRETNPVVEFADLLQRPRRVLGDEQHTAGVGQRDDASTAGNAFASELGTLAHRLLGRDEIWKAHESPRASCESAALSGPKVSLRERLSMTSRANAAMRCSAPSSAPSAPRLTPVG